MKIINIMYWHNLLNSLTYELHEKKLSCDQESNIYSLSQQTLLQNTGELSEHREGRNTLSLREG